MKLIYYGHFDRPSDCENWIANALTRAGILVYRWQRKLGSQHTDWYEFCNFVSAERINLVLFSKAPELTAQHLRDLRSRTGAKIVWWTFDWMADPRVGPWYFPLASTSDLCFQTDGTDVDGTYANQGIRRVELHQAADPDIHNRYVGDMGDLDRRRYTADVAFFGSLYTPRRKALDQFLRRQYGSRYKLWGGGDGFEQGLWNEEFRKAISVTKIVIGDNYTCEVPGYWSDRVYLTLACGGFFLTSYVRGLEDVFDTGKHLATWTDFNTLQAAIDKYLSEEPQRLAIAAAGYSFVQGNHTYNDRIKVFLERVNALL
jgi:hypothetical protein